MDFRFSSRSEASGEWQMFAAADPNVKRCEPMRSLSLGYGSRGTINPLKQTDGQKT
jgi:hypothetical protein